MTAGVARDPLALVGRVVEQVANQLVPDDVLAEAGETPADELLATALGNRLARMIASEDAPEQTDGSETDGSPEWLMHYQELLERNSAVAAALGACDCWGQDGGCPICDGAGRPGWALPDERLFAVYVQPAVSAPPAPHELRRTQSTSNNQTQERNDDQHMAR